MFPGQEWTLGRAHLAKRRNQSKMPALEGNWAAVDDFRQWIRFICKQKPSSSPVSRLPEPSTKRSEHWKRIAADLFLFGRPSSGKKGSRWL
jgi:hypothetical protein